ncbi:predicted protein [Nematostella vectensis]|uniref:Acyltransferase n=2 Tax=Nematostella vectensis TaxID=45351 RepID=A7RYM1_NEMVE|nr:predicted protein [Nematostella vectensis]|eukprot:XP_001635548.1 predicted protein [Nematostella vectensis]
MCTIFFLGHTLGTILAIYLVLSPCAVIAIIYLTWFYAFDLDISRQGGRRFEFFRYLKTWHFFRDYFPIKLIRTKRLDPKRNYVFGYHPHGIMCIGAWLNFATEATGFSQLFPGIKPYLLTLTLMFKFPFFRDFVMAGGVCEVSKESVEHVLSREGTGNAAVIVIGGAAESLDARPGSHKLTLKNRKGFVKYALKHGASLVPVYSFGENELYCQMDNPEGSWLRSLQKKLQRMLSFAPPVFFGRGLLPGSLGFLPHKRSVCTVVGAPVIVKRVVPNPSQKEIDRLHKKYITGLINLFQQHKHRYGIPKETRLIIQ